MVRAKSEEWEPSPSPSSSNADKENRKLISNQSLMTVNETDSQINKQSRQLRSRGEKKYE